MNKIRLAAVVLLMGVLAVPIQAELLKEQIDKTFPLRPNGTVSIENVNGPVRVNVWDRNELRVEAEKLVDARNASDLMRELKIEIDASADRIEIDTRYPDSKRFFNLFGGSNSIDVSYVLTMPRGATLKASTVNGSVAVHAAAGNITVNSVNGRVELNDVVGDIKAKTVNGSILAAVTPSRSGMVDLETVNGGIRVSLPADARVDVAAEAVNGSVTSELPMLTRTASRGRIRGEINGGGNVIRLETVNGSIKILKR
jgi:hypothetical protein